MTTNTAERSSSRPNVLALPSATTAQLILLLTAILSGGAYIGLSLHDWLLANSFVGAARACHGGALPQADPPAGYQQCFWPTEIRRGLFALGAALVLIVVLVAILLLAQIFIRRRRPGVEMTQYFEESRAYLAELKDSSGVSADTMILVGPSGQRDAFTYGAFGRYRIQLPRGLAVRWRTRALFEPVLLHELAHIQNGDLWLLALDRWLLPLFWLHPLYLRLRRRIRDDQELLGIEASHQRFSEPRELHAQLGERELREHVRVRRAGDEHVEYRPHRRRALTAPSPMPVVRPFPTT